MLASVLITAVMFAAAFDPGRQLAAGEWPSELTDEKCFVLWHWVKVR